MSRTEEKLSIIVGLRNNLDYTIAFYESVRRYYQRLELVFVSYGSTDSTHEWLDNLKDDRVVSFHSAESKNLSETYNKGVSLATGDLVSFLHNDMIMGAGFVESLVDAWKPHSVLFYSVVEPPIFVNDPFDWKIIQDFGSDLSTFDQSGFDAFVAQKQQNLSQPFPTKDTFFFLCVEKSFIQQIGGLDEIFNPMFCEDSDLMVRFHLLGAHFIQVPNSFVYHFVSKTSRYSEEFEQKTKQMYALSLRNFFRKWGFHPSSSRRKSYDMVVVLEHATLDSLYAIEPYFRKLYTDVDKMEYVSKYQSTSRLDLGERILPKSALAQHDVQFNLDASKLTSDDLERLPFLAEMITDHGIKNQKFLKRLFKDYSKIKVGNIVGEINNFRSIEREFPLVANQKS